MSATNPAFFMGRAELLGWINDTLGTRLTRIEDTCNGAIACQLMDALNPGSVPIKKLDFNARSEYDMINNYKVLQDVFNKQNVDKYIEVSKLIKGKPLDNTEFMQWFKMHFDTVTSGQPITDYDGAGRRAQSKTGDMKTTGGPAPAAGRMQRTADQGKMVPVATAGATPGSARSRPAGSLAPAASPGVGNMAGRDVSGSAAVAAAEAKEWRERCEALEKEKDFYYSKLRDIELLCQTPTVCDVPVMKRVEAILYSATAEEGRQVLISAQNEFANGVYLDDTGEPATNN